MGGLYRSVLANVTRHGLLDWAAAMSFYFLFALFPAVLITAAILSTFRLSGLILFLVKGLDHNLPGLASGLVSTGLMGLLRRPVPGLLSLGFLLLLYSAAQGFFGLMGALNAAYGVPETRTWLHRTAVAFGLTFTAGTLIALSLLVAMLGRHLLILVAGPSHSALVKSSLWPLLRWSVVVAASLFAVMLVYLWAPDLGHERRGAHRGMVRAVVHAMVLWTAASALLGWYMNHFSGYSRIYGALGAVIALMLWFYVFAFALLLGAEYHAEWLRATGLAATTLPRPGPRRVA